jgi:hypothetical protein
VGRFLLLFFYSEPVHYEVLVPADKTVYERFLYPTNIVDSEVVDRYLKTNRSILLEARNLGIFKHGKYTHCLHLLYVCVAKELGLLDITRPNNKLQATLIDNKNYWAIFQHQGALFKTPAWRVIFDDIPDDKRIRSQANKPGADGIAGLAHAGIMTGMYAMHLYLFLDNSLSTLAFYWRLHYIKSVKKCAPTARPFSAEVGNQTVNCCAVQSPTRLVNGVDGGIPKCLEHIKKYLPQWQEKYPSYQIAPSLYRKKNIPIADQAKGLNGLFARVETKVLSEHAVNFRAEKRFRLD